MTLDTDKALASDSSDQTPLRDARGTPFEEEVSVNYRKLAQRALDGKVSPRQAIKAFCLRCVGYARNDVRDCSAYTCPLWRYRPYQAGDEDEG